VRNCNKLYLVNVNMPISVTIERRLLHPALTDGHDIVRGCGGSVSSFTLGPIKPWRIFERNLRRGDNR
jgi:hypothetical protein